MQSILKKTLLAAAIAGVGTANAATISSGVTSGANGNPWSVVSAEGLAIEGSLAVGTDVNINYSTTAVYGQNDRITIQIAGGTIASTSSPTFTVTGGTSVADVQFVSFNAEAGTVTFRVLSSTTAAAGFEASLGGITLTDVGPVLSASAFGTFAGSSDAFDTADSTNIAQVASQFTFSGGTTDLNRVIDVENMRKQFVAAMGETGVLADTFDLGYTEAADVFPVTAGSVALTLNGSDLEFLRDGDGDLEASSYGLSGATLVTTGTGAPALSDDNTELSLTGTAPSGSFTVTLNADGAADADAQIIDAQEFTADLAVNYTRGTTPGSVGFTGADVGEWTLSGANVQVPFMPFGSGITQFFYVANEGGVSGDIEVTAIDQSGTVYGPVAVNATATANSVTNLTAAVINALTDAGANTSTGRMSFTLTINAPRADVEVFAGYNSRGNRVPVDTIKD